MSFVSDLDRTIKSIFRIGTNAIKSIGSKVLIRNAADTADANLVCHELETSGDGITLNSDAAGVGSDRSVRIGRSPTQTADYTLTLPPNAGSTGDIVSLVSPGVLSFAPPSGGSGGDAATLAGFTAAQLRDRATHTGTQATNTISGLSSEIRNTLLSGLSSSTATQIQEADSILIALGKLQAQINAGGGGGSLPTAQYKYLITDPNNIIDTTAGYSSFQSLANSGAAGNNPLVQSIKSNQPLFVAASGGVQAHILIPAGNVRFMVQNASSNFASSFEIIVAISYGNPATGDSNEIISFSGTGGAMIGLSSSKARIGRSAIAWDFIGNTDIVANQIFIAGFRWDNGQQRLRINSIEEGGSALTPVFNTAIEVNFSGGAQGDTRIFEIWGFSPALSSTQRSAVETHLTGKYL